jgi:hypothetical protein
VPQPQISQPLLRALPRVDDLALRLADEHPAVARPEILRAARQALD